ncbi:hypothetical protein D3C72_2070870 [compost metagenome]
MPEGARCAGQGCQCHAWVVLVERPVNRGAAGVHALGQCLLADLLRFHGLGDLPGDHALQGGCGYLLCKALACQEVVEIGANMCGHCFCLSMAAWRCLAAARSGAGVFWLFLMKP